MITGNTNEAWGLKSILDNSEDVAVFVVSELEDKILYCNYLVTLKTGRHEDSSFKGMWESVRRHMKECGEGRTYRCVEQDTPFGKNKNVTISRMVWQSSTKAYTFTVTPHIESEEENELEAIFKALGKSYLSVQVLDINNNKIKTVFVADHRATWYTKPIDFDTFKTRLMAEYVYEQDAEVVSGFLESSAISKAISEGKKNQSIQFRRKVDGEHRWTEFQISTLSDEDNNVKIVCTQRDIHGELALNEDQKINQMIMESLANSYRSVYLLDLESGQYTTVKPDELLFGIPGSGNYNNLMTIVSELIPDEGQKKDLSEYFAIEALNTAFDSGLENIGREYNSNLSEETSWMSISAFRPPFVQGLQNKCILTFMDITEHKRVEKERDETDLAINVLSARFKAVFCFDISNLSYRVIRLPQNYKYVEKQYHNMHDAYKHYLSAYVLEEYRESLLKDLERIISCGDNGESCTRESVYRNVDNRWIKLIIERVPGSASEFIMAFVDYSDILERYSLSTVYAKMMLANYDHMYEYDPLEKKYYELIYDGERLVRDSDEDNGVMADGFKLLRAIHPDDAVLFRAVCTDEIIEENLRNNKSVTHLYFRKMVGEDYHSYMYGFHYFEELGKKTILIMERDADKEIM